jgi:hypothetical protein
VVWVDGLLSSRWRIQFLPGAKEAEYIVVEEVRQVLLVKRAGLSMAPEFHSLVSKGRLDSPRAKRCCIVVSVSIGTIEIALVESLGESGGDGVTLLYVDSGEEGIVEDFDGLQEGVPTTPCSITFFEGLLVGGVEDPGLVSSVDQIQETMVSGTFLRRRFWGTCRGKEEWS